MVRWLPVHHDGALFKPKENVVVVVVVIDNNIISSDSRGAGMFKVIKKSLLPFHALHFYFLKHLSETQEVQTKHSELFKHRIVNEIKPKPTGHSDVVIQSH